MCTISFIPKRRGYTLAMNRDENINRVSGVPPALRVLNGVQVLCPSEPGGGTWIAVNETGATFALVNWYSVTPRVRTRAVSRGEIVAGVAALPSGEAVTTAFKTAPLQRVNPFRLMAVFPERREVVEWCWNLSRLVCRRKTWEAQQWISSGFDEPTAQNVRSQTFRRARRQRTARSVEWLRRLHRSHSPHTGAFSICMHRSDAKTVSYTEVRVSSHAAKMYYYDGAPCEAGALSSYFLQLRQPGRNPDKLDSN